MPPKRRSVLTEKSLNAGRSSPRSAAAAKKEVKQTGNNFYYLQLYIPISRV